jgi:FMN phosphatase YigB (HAD superfamily)
MSNLAFVFDADGVVIKRERWFSQILAEKLKLPEREFAEFFDGDFQACITGDADLKEIIKPWLTKWGWRKSVDELLEYWFTTEDQPYREVIDITQSLKAQNYSVYLATNQEEYRSKYFYDEMGFGKLFDHCFFSYEMHAKKPVKKYFDYIWNSLEYLDALERKSDILFIDNSEKNINGAKNAGFNTHYFTTPDQLRLDLKQRYGLSI